MAFEVRYSALDRAIHRIAFGPRSIQLTAADIERVAFGRLYREVEADRPIFLTSLPRAGTTLMLQAFHRFPTIATHRYRDMPFVMAPILWARLTGLFHQRGMVVERAHGDGVLVDYDSPEAFEEILWRTFWPAKYTAEAIDLWTASDVDDAATAFFADHMKKIIALRRPDGTTARRYLSKNNANIARLSAVMAMFPGARIVVPVREPQAHAASLARQHLNFTALHDADAFARRYMADIGHYEFGRLHRPLTFPGFAELAGGRGPADGNYWLAYWIAAFEHLAADRSRCIVFSFERARARPRQVLADLCERLDIPAGDALDRAAALFRAPDRERDRSQAFDPELCRRAAALHQTLVGTEPDAL